MISVSAQSVRYSKVKLNLYLFRHGKTAFNESGLLSGTSDDPLTEEGVYQLKKWSKNSNTRQPMLYFPVRCPVASKPPQSFTRSSHQLLFLIYERSVSGNWRAHPFRIFSPAISGGNCSAMILLSAFPEEKASRTAWTALFILWIPFFLRHVNRGWTRVAVSSHTCFIQILLSSVEDKASKAVAVVPNGMGYHILLDSDVWFRNRTFTLVDKIPREAW